MIRTLRCLVLGICFAAVLSTATAADFRTWSDASGKFTVKAKYVNVAAGKVTLEQEDGSSLEIELAKLSTSDQKYVKELQSAGDNPFKKSESPIQNKIQEQIEIKRAGGYGRSAADAGRLVGREDRRCQSCQRQLGASRRRPALRSN